MATRSLMALDYSNYHTNSILKKHARNRPLGAIEQKHQYVPAQPVLSCRTVDIDLPGTRTYRPKSTVDILEEQQRLIRSLRSRAAASAPPRPATEPAPRSLPDSGHTRVNIEVKGRPFTSQSQGTVPKSGKSDSSRGSRRPKTTGRLKNVQPATDSFMVIKVDKDLLASSQSTRELTSKLHGFWKSDPQSLATGRFMRGQKRPDDVPPSLDAWLTFGGAAGEESQGVVDAFASFKSCDEYYNIEGSVGSRVAQQLQKGDKIRIGINGIVQSHDFRVKKWQKDNGSSGPSTPQEGGRRKKTSSVEFAVEAGREGETGEERVQVAAEDIVKEETTQVVEENVREPRADSADFLEDDGDFKALEIGGLDELLEETAEPAKPSQTPNREVAAVETSMQQPETESERPPTPVIVPLSWDDQCTKPDVKVIQPTMAPSEQIRPVMSETFPIKFEKLIPGVSRPRLPQVNKDGYKIKQRPISKTTNQSGSSKVRVVYIDPLNPEDEAKVNKMSVEEIVNSKIEGRDRSAQRRRKEKHLSNERNVTDLSMADGGVNNDNIMTMNDVTGPPVGSRPNTSTPVNGKGGKAGKRAAGGMGSRPNSHLSIASDQARVASPKLMTIPIHPAAASQQQQTLSNHYQHSGQTQLNISTNNNIRHDGSSGDPPPSPAGAATNRSSRSLHTGGRNSPPKPVIQRLGSGKPSKGNKVKDMTPNHHNHQSLQYGEPEYIQITTKLNTGSAATPSPGYQAHQNHHNFAPGTNTPRDLDYQEAAPGDYITQGNELSSRLEAIGNSSTADKPPPGGDTSARVGSAKGRPSHPDQADNDTRASSPLSDSPAPTTVAISIPTADELSDRDESPSNSPPRGIPRASPDSAAMTPIQRRERNLRNEQIDQITDLLGAAIVEES